MWALGNLPYLESESTCRSDKCLYRALAHSFSYPLRHYQALGSYNCSLTYPPRPSSAKALPFLERYSDEKKYRILKFTNHLHIYIHNITTRHVHVASNQRWHRATKFRGHSPHDGTVLFAIRKIELLSLSSLLVLVLVVTGSDSKLKHYFCPVEKS